MNSSAADNVPQFVMDAIQHAIKNECEPIVQKAIADCDATVKKATADCEVVLRSAIHRATIEVARAIDYTLDGQHFAIHVTFREPRK